MLAARGHNLMPVTTGIISQLAPVTIVAPPAITGTAVAKTIPARAVKYLPGMAAMLDPPPRIATMITDVVVPVMAAIITVVARNTPGGNTPGSAQAWAVETKTADPVAGMMIPVAEMIAPETGVGTGPRTATREKFDPRSASGVPAMASAHQPYQLLPRPPLAGDGEPTGTGRRG